MGDPTSSRDALVAAAESLAIDQVTGQVVDFLHRQGARAIVLKGPSIARSLYDGRVRPYEDIDLLVAPDQFDTAGAHLAELGYAPLCTDSREGELASHALEWVKKRSPTVDLHRTLHGVEASPERCWEVLSARTRQLVVGGTTLEVLAPTGLAFNVVLHAVTSGTDHPKALDDLARALDRLTVDEWREVLDIASELDALAAFGVGLRLLPEGEQLAAELGVPERLSVELVLRASSMWRMALPFDRVAKARGLGAKAAILARELVPTPSFVRMWFRQFRPSGGGLAVAYLYRFYWVTRHAPKGLAAWTRARRTVATGGTVSAGRS